MRTSLEGSPAEQCLIGISYQALNPEDSKNLLDKVQSEIELLWESLSNRDPKSFKREPIKWPVEDCNRAIQTVQSEDKV